jgi:outer membrane lipopolysaccharide assembly protein LptE/RlpB
MKIISVILLITILSSCWPKSVSFVDGSMPDEWETFYVETVTSLSPNAPISYPASLSESIKDGIQNKTRLLLNTSSENSELYISGEVLSYTITPLALQEGDNAAKNRMTINASFKIDIRKPEVDQMTLNSSKFVDYDSNTDLASVENSLLEEINEQIVQDVINKLLSNW